MRRGVAEGITLPSPDCIEDVRACLVAMSAPSTCANHAAECLEASARGRASGAPPDESQPR